MISLQTLEDQLQLLRKVDIATLDLESRVEYHLAMIAVQKARMKNLLFYFKYKTALIVEAEIKDEQKQLDNCYALMSEAEIKRARDYDAKGKNRFTEMAEQGKLTATLSPKEIESNVRTILFGVPFELLFDGSGFTVTKTFAGLNIETELDKLEEYCAANEFSLLDNEKRTKRKKGESERPFYIEILKGN